LTAPGSRGGNGLIQKSRRIQNPLSAPNKLVTVFF
jgi:hypothetical protein